MTRGRDADLVVAGRIITLAGDAGLGEVEAVAVREGRVVAAGSRDEVDVVTGPRTRRLRLAPDEVAVPGLTDAHLHLAEAALAAGRLDLAAAATLEDALHAIAARHRDLPTRAWLTGHGWDPDRWGGWPTAADLQRAAPGRHAALWAHDRHALWVSEAALAVAAIDRATPDPPGGLIRRGDDGRPTGILHEEAVRLVNAHVPRPTPEEIERAIPVLADTLLRLGVVAVHDPGGLTARGGLGPAVAAYRRLAAAGALPLRVHVSVRAEQLDAAIDEGLRSGEPLGDGESIRIGWLKLFADGTLGSRTAALLEPIEPEPGRPVPPGTERGIFLTPPERLATLAARAADAGIATQIHVIGDAAVRAGLDALASTVGRTPLVPRLEHVQLLHPDDLPRFAATGVAASVQPVHLRADAATARAVWGERAERFAYPWAALVRSGALVAFGTDAPVEPLDPWPGLGMAIARRDPSWPVATAPFGRQNALTLAEALRAACLVPAVTAGETDRGRLVPGHRADLVVIPAEALTEASAADGTLAATRPRLVVVGGRIVSDG